MVITLVFTEAPHTHYAILATKFHLTSQLCFTIYLGTTLIYLLELGAHKSDMEVITKNKEDYISFSIKVPVDSYIDKNGEEKDKLIELRFIDSFKLMSSSFDSLTKNLVSGGKKLFGFEDYSELQYDLLTRKGVYPYGYINSWDRFNETQLRPIDAFYSNLNMSLINEDDYQHAQKVWQEFGIRNLGDYHHAELRELQI